MEVLSALVCDAAEDYQGKLCVLGAFDTLMAHQFPVAHPHCAVALRLLFRAPDEGRHVFCVRLIDSDGAASIPEMRMEMDVRLPEELYFLSRNLILNLQGLPFASPGQYSLDVMMDDSMVARIPLQVIALKPYAGEVEP
ncbi:MAG: hypothetical protein PW734_07580 [Verrucomicrobium sp.]|nr:hypothetical protein [Verrucomicrobium sp.]